MKDSVILGGFNRATALGTLIRDVCMERNGLFIEVPLSDDLRAIALGSIMHLPFKEKHVIKNTVLVVFCVRLLMFLCGLTGHHGQQAHFDLSFRNYKLFSISQF